MRGWAKSSARLHQSIPMIPLTNNPGSPGLDTGPVQGRIVYPKLYKGAVLSLSDGGGKFLGRARLSAYSPRELELGRPEGVLSLPVMEPGSTVSVQGKGDGNSLFSLFCRVAESDRTGLRLTDLELMASVDERGERRYAVGRPAWVYAQDGIRTRQGEPCALADISMTGARIRTYEKYDAGQAVKLQVELYERAGKISFMCEVIRICSLEGGGYEYGLLIEELPFHKKKYLREDLDWLAEHG